MRQRLFDDSKNKTMLEDIQVIDEVFKVATNDAKGEDEVKRVSRTLGFSEFESVVDFRSRNVFSSFMKALNILPTSTADCEQGFSDMNLTITDLRTSLNIENVSDLMFISINGPSVADFNPRPYIKIWLRDHRSAVSTPRGKERKEIDDENKMQKLFFNN
ncbi:E3 SUMO-protein ligase KIAA1586-like, partial [Melanaphis sacchari]|uniref:E3 SUMO-protein ligase KIAA1586-like n=1 Tax=Melanaphis sacchari TaxID=742174 RepID=UPI000DC13BB0